MKEVINFSAGPAILPKEVFQKASQAVFGVQWVRNLYFRNVSPQ